jgi:hypothetical protein
MVSTDMEKLIQEFTELLDKDPLEQMVSTDTILSNFAREVLLLNNSTQK